MKTDSSGEYNRTAHAAAPARMRAAQPAANRRPDRTSSVVSVARLAGTAAVDDSFHAGFELAERPPDGHACGCAGRFAQAPRDLLVALLILEPREQGGAVLRT